MQHEDGYCDRCGCDLRDGPGWLTITGDVTCGDCATGMAAAVEPRAKKPEARDDGR